MRKLIVASAGVLMLTACNSTKPATSPGLESQITPAVSKPVTPAGPNRTYEISAEKLVPIVRQALTNQRLKVDKEIPGQAQTTIAWRKPVSAFSWGETGTVTVASTGEQTATVSVVSKKNVAVNVTAKTEKQFAREIFEEIDKLVKG